MSNLEKLRAARVNTNGRQARLYNLAYGLLRDRNIDRIESVNSNPYLFPPVEDIVNLTLSLFPLKGEPCEEMIWHFRNDIVRKLTAWKKQLLLNHMTMEIHRRNRNAAKRSLRPQKVT